VSDLRRALASGHLDRIETWRAAQDAILRQAAERQQLEALLRRALTVARQHRHERDVMARELVTRTWGVHPLHPRLPLPLCMRVANWFGRVAGRVFPRGLT
jgi:hypothetical protein